MSLSRRPCRQGPWSRCGVTNQHQGACSAMGQQTMIRMAHVHHPARTWTPPRRRTAPPTRISRRSVRSSPLSATTPAATPGRDDIVTFLHQKWARELEYRLIKEVWTYGDNRIAVRFADESRSVDGQWFPIARQRELGVRQTWPDEAAARQYQRHRDRRRRACDPPARWSESC